MKRRSRRRVPLDNEQPNGSSHKKSDEETSQKSEDVHTDSSTASIDRATQDALAGFASPETIMELQRFIGNQATLDLINGSTAPKKTPIQRAADASEMTFEEKRALFENQGGETAGAEETEAESGDSELVAKLKAEHSEPSHIVFYAIDYHQEGQISDAELYGLLADVSLQNTDKITKSVVLQYLSERDDAPFELLKPLLMDEDTMIRKYAAIAVINSQGLGESAGAGFLFLKLIEEGDESAFELMRRVFCG